MRLPTLAAKGIDATSKVRATHSATEPEFLRNRLSGYYQSRLGPHGGRNLIVGRAPGPRDIVLQSNDYLRVGNHPDVIGARAEGARLDSDQSVMSAVFQGLDSPQAKFERSMAEFVRCESVLLSQSGWNANVGLVQALACEGAPVYIDQMAHMSLWEGVTSAGARPIVFRHNRVEHLETLIARNGPGLILVDAIYSTSGSVAPLVDIANLAAAQDCVLVVDESHSLGTHGPGGAGLVVELGLLDRVHLRTASLAKAFAGRGGLVAGSERIIEFLRFQANPAIFSSGLLPGEIHVFNAVLDALRDADLPRRRLRRNTAFLKARLLDLGYDVSSSDAHIFGLVAGPEYRTFRLRDALERQGVFGSVFAAPATPKNRSLLRLSIHAELSHCDLARIVTACEAIRDEVELDQWRPHRRRGDSAPPTERPAPAATCGRRASLENSALMQRIRARFRDQFPQPVVTSDMDAHASEEDRAFSAWR